MAKKIRVNSYDEELQVSENVQIAQKFHLTLRTDYKDKVQEICDALKLKITFPDRKQKAICESSDGAPVQDIVVVRGRPDNCETAKNELLALLPISEQVNLPFEYHPSSIGKGGQEIRRLMNQGDEILSVPFDDLAIHEFRGRGGYSRVNRASWLPKDMTVALKIPNKGTQVEEVKKEAQLFNLLNHKNILAFYGASFLLPHLHIVLEYCYGGSLRLILDRKKNISNEILIDWAKQIAEGMCYLHNQSIFHNDLKSSNVLVKEPLCPHGGHVTNLLASCGRENIQNKTLKITDFGLAIKADATSMKMRACGTPAFMAPEVIKSGTFSKASDVWSYGTLLWELQTGETPYEHLDLAPAVIAYRIGVNKLALLIPSTCPESLKTIMENCWNIEREKRPTFEDLEGLLSELVNEGSLQDGFRWLFRYDID